MAEMSVPARKWLVGLDLRPASQGAARLAAWLVARRAVPGDTALAVHVVDKAHLNVALENHSLHTIVANAKEAARHVLATIGLADAFSEIFVEAGASAENTLREERERLGGDVLVIGRLAGMHSHRLQRLGRTARKLVAVPDVATIVVPPDYTPSEEVGPVLVATDLGDRDEALLMFARELQVRLGTSLHLVHCVPYPEDYAAHYLSANVLAHLRSTHQREGEEELSAWATENQAEDATCTVLQGATVDQLLDYAASVNASFLVCGHRNLSTVERFLLTSVGSEIAAHAPIPVAIVPVH